MGIVSHVTADHPLNAPLLAMLEAQGVKGSGDVYDLDGWQLHTHPDLCEHLQALNRACYQAVYGVPVLANDKGIFFAVARGTSSLAFRLPEPERSEAAALGGRPFVEGGKDWMMVEAWRTDKDTLMKWCRAAHSYANSIKE